MRDGLRRKEGISSLAFPAFRFAQSGINPDLPLLSVRKLALGAVPGYYQPAARDWIWMRAVWKPTLRKTCAGAGLQRYGELQKKRGWQITRHSALAPKTDL